MATRRAAPAARHAAATVKARFLVLHGPNLNLLGEREPEIYGSLTLDEVNARVREAARRLSISVDIRQSNHEGELIDILHATRRKVDGIVLNPGAYAHTSLALADAVRSVSLPAIEVHLSNVFAREGYRRELAVAPACHAVVMGLGWRGYVVGLQALLALMESAD